LHRTVNHNLSAIGLQDAGQDLDERRFTGAVLAQETNDLAREEFHTDATERLQSAETTANLAKFNDWRAGRRTHGRVGVARDVRSRLVHVKSRTV
jgi:hypothetical protein